MRVRFARHTAVGLAVVLAALLAACDSKSHTPAQSILQGTIPVGIVDDAPGYSEGALHTTGFDIDLKNYIGRALNAQMTPTLLTYSERNSELLNKKAALIIATYSITPERNDAGVDFAGPYMVTPNALLVRADYHGIKHKDDLKGKSVCTVETSTGAQTEIPGANMDTHEATTQDCVNLLNRKDTDAVFTDALILYGYTHANPGKYKVVLPGVFGELQYLGVGLKGGQHKDCVKLDKVLQDYLQSEWLQDFQQNFPDAVSAYRGSDVSKGNFESQFKPNSDDMDRLSCKL